MSAFYYYNRSGEFHLTSIRSTQQSPQKFGLGGRKISSFVRQNAGTNFPNRLEIKLISFVLEEANMSLKIR